MLQNRIRITNRRVIFMTLLVWLATQALKHLQPFGVPPFLASSLATTGLFVLPAVLLWPWIRNWFLDSNCKAPLSQQLNKETRSQALVCGEIATLSAILLFLLTQMTP